jgi:hypothetical protein
MLYFVGYADRPGSWTGGFTRTVRKSLFHSGIEFLELPPYDWSGPSAPLRNYLRINSKAEDSWFIGWAQSPLIELIKQKQGRKYGLVVGLTKNNFDPLTFTVSARGLNEEKRLGHYDKIFANSRWCGECIRTAYPEFAQKVIVTGFPHDLEQYQRFHKTEKESGLIVFNQRFALERLHILELEIARRLTKKGYRVKHLLGTPRDRLQLNDTALSALFAAADEAGLEFVYNPDKEAYYRNLAQASVVITTPVTDMLPASLIESIALGAVPVAPNAFCFPEFVHKDNLYTPYDLNEIINIAENRPQRSHPIQQYDYESVVNNFLREMNLA